MYWNVLYICMFYIWLNDGKMYNYVIVYQNSGWHIQTYPRSHYPPP